MTGDGDHLTRSEYRTARLNALGLAGHGRLIAFGIVTGGFCSVLAATVGLSPLVIDAPYFTIGMSFVFGCFPGLLCGFLVMALLNDRDYRSASWIVLGLTAPLVCLAALISAAFNQLLYLAMFAFCFATFVAWFRVPKIWLDEGLCRSCGYDLHGSMLIGRCPECGTEISNVVHDQRCVPRWHPFAPPTNFAIGVLVSIVLAGIMLGEASYARRALPFDAATWQAMPVTGRHPMARGLVARKTLIGLTEREVEDLLGEPASRSDRDIFALDARSALIVNYNIRESVETVIGSSLPRAMEDRSFDRSLWLNGMSGERLAMARSLITERSDQLYGLSRAEVHDLLGAPERQRLTLNYKIGTAFPNARTRRQRLLRSTHMLSQPTDLFIEFEEGKVTSTRLFAGSD